MSNVMQRMDIFFDHRAPSIVVDIAEYEMDISILEEEAEKYEHLLRLPRITYAIAKS